MIGLRQGLRRLYVCLPGEFRRGVFRFADKLRESLHLYRNPSPRDPYEPLGVARPIERSGGGLSDPERGMRVEYDLYRPQILSGKHPVVVFSLGLHFVPDEPPTDCAYLAEHFAAHGYVVIVLRHPDSDLLVMPLVTGDRCDLKKNVLAAGENWKSAHDRIRDLSFVLDTLKAWNDGIGAEDAHAPLAGHLDMNRIGMSGHSYGARTALALIGEAIGEAGRSYKDPRIKAGFVCSPSPSWKRLLTPKAFAAVEIPVLQMTGSREWGWIDDSLPEDRTVSYDKMHGPGKYLLFLKGADHVVFSGARNGKPLRTDDPRHHQIIRSTALAFWDAYLKDDENARRWLDHECDGVLGREGRLSRK